MANIIEEGEIRGAIEPVTMQQTETILEQMENSVCRITSEHKNGTGFFCKIELNREKIKVLITNYHIINDDLLYSHETIKINLKNKCIPIKLNKNRKIYSSDKTEYDIMILKIYPYDDIQNINYLELDDNLLSNKSELIYEDTSIYILHFPMSKEINVSYGYGIKEKDKNNIMHKCKTAMGSSGAPILNLSTNKVIGIHKSYINSTKKDNKENCYNLGTLLKYPLIKLNKKNDPFRKNIKKEKVAIKGKKMNKNISNLNINKQSPIIGNKNELNEDISYSNKRLSNQKYDYLNNNNIKNDDLKTEIINELSNQDFNLSKNKKNNNYKNYNGLINKKKFDLIPINEKPNKSISKRNSFKNMDNNIYLTTTKNERKISKYNSIKINNNHINNNHIKGKEKPIEKNIANSIINKKLSKKNSLLFLNKKNKINIFFSQSHMNFYNSNINNSIKQKIMDYNAQTFNNLLSAKLRNKKVQTPKMNFYQNSLKYNNFYNRYNNLSQKIKNNYSHDMASNNLFQKEEEFY